MQAAKPIDGLTTYMVHYKGKIKVRKKVELRKRKPESALGVMPKHTNILGTTFWLLTQQVQLTAG